jgi:hypothetical protein
MIRLLFSGLLLFATLGLFLSRVLCLRVGLEPDYFVISLGALAITLLVVFRSLPMILLMGFLTLAVNLPDQVLVDYGVDRDVILTLVLCLMFFPFVRRSLSR